MKKNEARADLKVADTLLVAARAHLRDGFAYLGRHVAGLDGSRNLDRAEAAAHRVLPIVNEALGWISSAYRFAPLPRGTEAKAGRLVGLEAAVSADVRALIRACRMHR